MRLSLALLIALFTTTAGCWSRDTQPVTMEDVADELRPRQESWNASLLISNDGIPRVSLSAARWQEFEKGDSTFTLLSADPEQDSSRVAAFLYDETGEQTAEVFANEMHLFSDEDRFEAMGNVIVRTSTDRILETEHLLWWESNGRIEAPGFVKLTAPRETIQGFELDSDEDLENYTLGRVTGQILVEE